MNKNIDLTELLRGYPKGTKLYSKALGTVTFDCIKSDKICIKDHKGIEIYYAKSAKYYYAEEDAVIDLFPSKDQCDWSKWRILFVPGDVVMYNEDQFAIFEKYINYPEYDNIIRYYVYYDAKNDDLDTEGGQACVKRLATEEEKATLFQAIKDNGYKWNADEKKLEKLIVPKFKVGDRIISIENEGRIYTINGVYNSVYGLEELDLGLPINEQDNWELVPDKIELKFKVGDIIRSKNGLQTYKITNATPEYYSVKVQDHAVVGLLPVKDQDDWILIPNKFDPKTLKPFDKVLVSCNDEWFCDFFSHYDDAVVKFNCICTGGCPYDCCIPYNEDTKHLIGKSIEDAPEFYRYWEYK